MFNGGDLPLGCEPELSSKNKLVEELSQNPSDQQSTSTEEMS